MRILASLAVISLALAGPGIAQTSTSLGGATKMSQSDCTSEWSKLDTSNTGSVGQPQAQSLIADFSSADTDKDGKLSRTEFMSACDKGLVRSSAVGTGTGSRGMTGDGTTPSTPAQPGSTTK
jgi:hypothetical protein